MRQRKEETKIHNIEVGQRLQIARKNGKYSQDQFAEAFGIEVEHYRKLEKGVHGLNLDKIKTLHEKYRVNPTFLVTGMTSGPFDAENFIINCSTEDREKFINFILEYVRRILLKEDEED